MLTRHYRLISALALTLPLAACVPNLGTAPTPRTASSLASAQTVPDEGGQWPGDGWWKRYADPQLDTLIQEGLTSSPDIATAAARLARAQGIADSANLGPTLTAKSSGTAVHTFYKHGLSFDDSGQSGSGSGSSRDLDPGDYPNFEGASLNGALDLDLWGRNHARLRAARRDADAARFDQAEARIVIAASIASAYADLARYYAERDVAVEATRVQADTAGLVSNRVRSGLDTEGQRRQASAQVPASQADVTAIDEAIAITRNELAALVGAGPDRGVAITRPTLAPPAPAALPASAGIELIGRRPDIVAARTRVEAASEQEKAAKAAFYPNISLSALLGFQNISLGSLVSGQVGYVQGGPALSLPIFDNGRLQGDYRAARADYASAVADYDRILVLALQQVANAVASRNSLAAQAAQVKASLADSEQAYKIARLRYEGGLSTYIEVLTAEQQVLLARRRDADLTARGFALDVALVRALGGGFAA